MTHTGKGFNLVNEAEVDHFLESHAFSTIQWMLAVWSLVSLSFLILFVHLKVLSSHIVET